MAPLSIGLVTSHFLNAPSRRPPSLVMSAEGAAGGWYGCGYGSPEGWADYARLAVSASREVSHAR